MLVVVKWTFDELYYFVIIIFYYFFIVISYVPFMAVIRRIKVYIYFTRRNRSTSIATYFSVAWSVCCLCLSVCLSFTFVSLLKPFDLFRILDAIWQIHLSCSMTCVVSDGVHDLKERFGS